MAAVTRRSVPMEQINLHFTGDFAAIAAGANLLAAMIDNHIHHGQRAFGFDVRRVTWKRVMDMNDRALRDIIIGLGGPTVYAPRKSNFDIVVASEIMAASCAWPPASADLKGAPGASWSARTNRPPNRSPARS